MNRQFLKCAIVTAAFFATDCAKAQYDNACPTGNEMSPSAIANDVGPSVLQVLVTRANGEEVPNGTASLIDARGYFITAGHVVENYNKVRLRGQDGSIIEGKVVKNYLTDEKIDIAIFKSSPAPEGLKPIQLRLSNPFRSGAPKFGYVISYENKSVGDRSTPNTVSISGVWPDPSTMKLGLSAKGGNSGALVLEPNGRAFSVLTRGPEFQEMEIPLTVPETIIPRRDGKNVLPETTIEILPEDIAKAVAAASSSKAISISGLWDRIAASIPPSKDVDNAISKLRTGGWKSAQPIIYQKFSAIDLIHLYIKVSSDLSLTIGAAFDEDFVNV